MKPTEFEINCIMSSINEVQQVQKAMNEYGVTDRYNYENKHYIRTSLTEGEQTFTRKDDILREPAAKG